MRVFVVGNVTEDLFFGVPRLPLPGETLIADTQLADLGGKGLNQAVVAGRAGAEVRLVAAVGRDAVADRVRGLVAAEGLDSALIATADLSDRSLIAVAASGENTIISSAVAADALAPERAVDTLAGAISGDLLLVQGNLSRATTLALLRRARALGLTTVANPSPIRWSWAALWPLVDTAVVNRPELADLTGCAETEDGLTALRAAGCGRVLLTLGADGALLATAEARVRRPAAAARVVDTAGAGDTVCGVFVAALARGLSAGDALDRALLAAAVTVSQRGTMSAFPSAEWLRAQAARIEGGTA